MELLNSYNISLKENEIKKSAERLLPDSLIINYDNVIREHIENILNKHSDESSKWGLGFVASIGKDSSEFVYNLGKKILPCEKKIVSLPFNSKSSLVFRIKKDYVRRKQQFFIELRDKELDKVYSELRDFLSDLK